LLAQEHKRVVLAPSRRGLKIPVIVLTGHGDPQTAVRALNNGAVHFLEKPFNDDILLERIRRALASPTYGLRQFARVCKSQAVDAADRTPRGFWRPVPR
jgi:FixJ family two-component response regulator